MLRLVENMKGELGKIGARVDMYEHSLQTATRAPRRRRHGDDRVRAAARHRRGALGHQPRRDHRGAAAVHLAEEPLSNKDEVFQAYYLDKCGGDKNLRDKVREYTDAGIVKGHEWYDATETFCIKYDQPSFDPTYDTDPMESFVRSSRRSSTASPSGGSPRTRRARPARRASRSAIRLTRNSVTAN